MEGIFWATLILKKKMVPSHLSIKLGSHNLYFFMLTILSFSKCLSWINFCYQGQVLLFTFLFRIQFAGRRCNGIFHPSKCRSFQTQRFCLVPGWKYRSFNWTYNICLWSQVSAVLYFTFVLMHVTCGTGAGRVHRSCPRMHRATCLEYLLHTSAWLLLTFHVMVSLVLKNSMNVQ